MGTQLGILEEGPKVDIHLDALKTTLKKYQTGKPLNLMTYTDFGFKKSHPSTTEWQYK